MPKKAHASDAGLDLVAVSREWVEEERCYVYHTGIAMDIPAGYVGLVFPRSSIAKKHISLSNSVGVIDSGYRGEILAKFKQCPGLPSPNGELPLYEKGDRIAQLIVMPYPEVELVEVAELSASERGRGGYGSTGR